MMTMKTQFGNMTITDDNKTIASKELQNEINDSIMNDKIVEFVDSDIAENGKTLDK